MFRLALYTTIRPPMSRLKTRRLDTFCSNHLTHSFLLSRIFLLIARTGTLYIAVRACFVFERLALSPQKTDAHIIYVIEESLS